MALHLHVKNRIRLTDIGQGAGLQRKAVRPLGATGSAMERQARAHEDRIAGMIQRKGSTRGFWSRMKRGFQGLGKWFWGWASQTGDYYHYAGDLTAIDVQTEDGQTQTIPVGLHEIAASKRIFARATEETGGKELAWVTGMPPEVFEMPIFGVMIRQLLLGGDVDVSLQSGIKAKDFAGYIKLKRRKEIGISTASLATSLKGLFARQFAHEGDLVLTDEDEVVAFEGAYGLGSMIDARSVENPIPYEEVGPDEPLFFDKLRNKYFIIRNKKRIFVDERTIPPPAKAEALDLLQAIQAGSYQLQRRRMPGTIGSFDEEDEAGAEAFADFIRGRRRAGRGFTLDETVKRRLEEFLGVPLDDIKIHTGFEAGKVARLAEAEAFTVGNEIYFGDGKYNPETPEGLALLAHEVTHVLQQKGRVEWGTETATPERMEAAAIAAERRFLNQGPKDLSRGPGVRDVSPPQMTMRAPEPSPPSPEEMPTSPTPIQSRAAGGKTAAGGRSRAIYHTDPGGMSYLETVARAYGVTIGTDEFVQDLTERVYELMQEEAVFEAERRETGVW